MSLLFFARANKRYITGAYDDRRQIFQVENSFRPVSFQDIEDCLTVSHNMKSHEAKEYMYSNGIDYDRVQKYYYLVQTLEHKYNNVQKEEFERFITSIMSTAITTGNIGVIIFTSVFANVFSTVFGNILYSKSNK